MCGFFFFFFFGFCWSGVCVESDGAFFFWIGPSGRHGMGMTFGQGVVLLGGALVSHLHLPRGGRGECPEYPLVPNTRRDHRLSLSKLSLPLVKAIDSVMVGPGEQPSWDTQAQQLVSLSCLQRVGTRSSCNSWSIFSWACIMSWMPHACQSRAWIEDSTCRTCVSCH